MKIRLLIIPLLALATIHTQNKAAAPAKQYGPQGKKVELAYIPSNEFSADILFADFYKVPAHLFFSQDLGILAITGRNQTYADAQKKLSKSWSFDKKNTFRLGEIILFPWREQFSEESDYLSYRMGIIVSLTEPAQKKGEWLVRVNDENDVYSYKTDEIGKYKVTQQ